MARVSLNPINVNGDLINGAILNNDGLSSLGYSEGNQSISRISNKVTSTGSVVFNIDWTSLPSGTHFTYYFPSGSYLDAYKSYDNAFIYYNYGENSIRIIYASAGYFNYWFGFVRDDDTQEAWLVYAGTTNPNNNFYAYYRDWFYSSFDGITEPIVTYEFQSVAEIVGQGKHYILAQLANSTDGEPVSGASSSMFEVLDDESLVKNIIDEILFEHGKVIVTYTIPSASYGYIKLVYKKSLVPQDYSDGTAIDILQSSTSQIVEGLESGSTYYFVIFTNFGKSSAVEFKIPQPILFKPDFYTDGRDVINYDPNNVIDVLIYGERESVVEGAAFFPYENDDQRIEDGKLFFVEEWGSCTWALDVAKHKNVVPLNCNIIIECDFYIEEDLDQSFDAGFYFRSDNTDTEYNQNDSGILCLFGILGFIYVDIADNNINKRFDASFSYEDWDPELKSWHHSETILQLVDGCTESYKFKADGQVIREFSATSDDQRVKFMNLVEGSDHWIEWFEFQAPPQIYARNLIMRYEV